MDSVMSDFKERKRKRFESVSSLSPKRGVVNEATRRWHVEVAWNIGGNGGHWTTIYSYCFWDRKNNGRLDQTRPEVFAGKSGGGHTYTFDDEAKAVEFARILNEECGFTATSQNGSLLNAEDLEKWPLRARVVEVQQVTTRRLIVSPK